MFACLIIASSSVLLFLGFSVAASASFYCSSFFNAGSLAQGHRVSISHSATACVLVLLHPRNFPPTARTFSDPMQLPPEIFLCSSIMFHLILFHSHSLTPSLFLNKRTISLGGDTIGRSLLEILLFKPGLLAFVSGFGHFIRHGSPSSGSQDHTDGS